MIRRSLVLLFAALTVAALGAEATARLSHQGSVSPWQIAYMLSPTATTRAAAAVLDLTPALWTRGLAPLAALPLWLFMAGLTVTARIWPHQTRRRKIFRS